MDASTKAQSATPSQPVALRTFAPDLDPTTDGIIIDALNVYPIARGFRTFPGQRVLGTGLPSPCFGSYSGIVGSTPMFVAATGTAGGGLYLADANGNLHPSQLGFINTTNRWRFAPYGTPTVMPAYQDLIATDGIDPIQYYSPATGVWAPLPPGSVDGSPPPLASIVAPSDFNIIFVLPNSQTFISSLNEKPPTWLGSVPYQVYVQSIPQSAGPITACGRLRNAMIFYKPNAMHIGYFTGGTVGWNVQDLSLQYGCLNQEWVVNTGDYHFFPTLTHDFWQFDGWNLTRLPNDMAEFFRQDHSDTYMYKMFGMYDAIRELVIWVYSSMQANPPGTLDTWLIYYLRKSTWAFQRLPVELPMTYTNPTNYHNYIGFFGMDHAPRIYDDAVAPNRSYVTSQYFGDGHWMYETQRIRPVFSLYPEKAGCTPINQYVPGKTWGPPGDQEEPQGSAYEPLSDDGWFNLQNTSRWAAFQVTMYGLAEIQSLEPILVGAGES